MSKKETKNLHGSVFGGVLLIAGSCIGAGMLGLPILTGLIGFFPSLLMFVLGWGFMLFTALLLIEINGWFSFQVNIVSMAEASLGKWGKVSSWLLYLFLFYSLLVGYISVSGGIFSAFLQSVFSIHASPSVASLFFVALFGSIVYLGTRPVDIFNRILMFGLICTYCLLIGLGLAKIDAKLLLQMDFSYAMLSLPILVISFGFHNMIPSLTAYVKGDLQRMRKIIIFGSLLALAIYLLWELLVLGIVPIGGKGGLLDCYNEGKEGAEAIGNFIDSPWVIVFAKAFAFFAIITSFLAQSLGLMHFIADGIKVKLQKKTNWWLILLTILPPTFFALIYPQAFYSAMNFAGGFCAVILFGLFPALMAWIGRYRKNLSSSYRVRGGKTSLILAISFSLIVFFSEFFRVFGNLYFQPVY